MELFELWCICRSTGS